MAQHGPKFFILTGEPGVGKTTLAKKISTTLQNKGIKVLGFYTEEVRNNRVRVGFDVVTVEGKRGKLARDLSLLDEPVKFKVGKYGVLVQEFENVALPTLEKLTESRTCLLIDEIGKMEFFSSNFKSKIKEIFSPNASNIILATIPIRSVDNLIEYIRNNSMSRVWSITRENRDTIHDDIVNEMQKALGL